MNPSSFLGFAFVISSSLVLVNTWNSTSYPGHRSKRTLRIKLLTTPELVQAYGYPIEVHRVISPDGYVIELHRIPRGRKSRHEDMYKKRTPILLMHGLMGSSIDWLQNHPDRALGFMLADLGYDVWLGNDRGNKYSRKHLAYSEKERIFWMFSWHEIAFFDLPTVIDFVLSKSKMKKLFYIGFSCGCTSLAAMLSEWPQYNDKIKAVAFIGPAIYLTHSTGALLRYSPFSKPLEKVFDLLKIWVINPQNKMLKRITMALCRDGYQLLNKVCWDFYSRFVIQINEEFINKEFLPYILSNLPAGVSMKSCLHFWQVKNAARFQKYDYGPNGNLRVYGTTEPPAYHLNRTRVPVGLFTSTGDKYASKEDTDRLERELPNLEFKYETDNEKFGHFNFLWSTVDVSFPMYKNMIYFLSLHS